jgi:hypothetical protein
MVKQSTVFSHDASAKHLARLYRGDSNLGRIADPARRNADCPASGALYAGCAHLLTALARAGSSLKSAGAVHSYTPRLDRSPHLVWRTRSGRASPVDLYEPAIAPSSAKEQR